MLKLKRTHHLSLPRLSFSWLHSMKLSKVSSDDDELAKAIDNDPVDHDNNWQLTDRPDTEELEQYWTNVEDEIKSDPEWIDFAKE